MSIWCVVEYESDGGCRPPAFFATRKDAGAYIHCKVVREVNDLGEFPESYISENYIDCLRAQVCNYDFSIVWEGFEVGNDIEDILYWQAEHKGE